MGLVFPILQRRNQQCNWQCLAEFLFYCFKHFHPLFLCLGSSQSYESWEEMESTSQKLERPDTCFPASPVTHTRASDLGLANQMHELGALGTRNRDGEEAIPRAEILWQHPVSYGGNRRVLTDQLPWHGASGCHVSFCLCSFSKLVSQTQWKFCKQPNVLSINPFSAGIIQSRVLLLATENSGWFSLGED